MSDAPTTDAPQPSSDSVEFKVFAGNLAYAVTDDTLKAFFGPIANDILTAQVITRGSRSAGYGFVTVKSLEAAQKACELLDKKELEGRQVVVEVAKPAEQKDKERTEKRANRRAGRARGRAPPGEVTEAEASGDAEKPVDAESGALDSESQPKRKSKKKRVPRKKNQNAGDATAPVETDAGAKPASAPADANTASDAAPRKKTPRTPKEKRPQRPAGEDPAGEPSTTVLFVANLGFNIDDAGLSELFTNAGINVISARVVRRRWGKPRRSKGYGFVDVGGEDEQKKAIATLQGKEIEGREIAVKVAVNANHDDESQGANGTGGQGKESSPEATILAQ